MGSGRMEETLHGRGPDGGSAVVSCRHEARLEGRQQDMSSSSDQKVVRTDRESFEASPEGRPGRMPGLQGLE